MFDLLVAANLLLTAPQSIVGADQGKIQARFGAPDSIATDFRPSSKQGAKPDDILTLDWPQLRIRLYVSAATNSVSLLGVTATSDVLKIDSPVHVGVDRGTVLRELGGPAYEDENQIVYALPQGQDKAPPPTVRIVFRDERVVGFDWTYPIGE
jgi:hypothetical protein